VMGGSCVIAERTPDQETIVFSALDPEGGRGRELQCPGAATDVGADGRSHSPAANKGSRHSHAVAVRDAVTRDPVQSSWPASRRAASALAARSMTVSRNPADWPMNRLSLTKLWIAATAPELAVETGRITETGGKPLLRKTVGSGRIRLVWSRLSLSPGGVLG